MTDETPRAPRCLMFYPWNLNDRSGALEGFLRYSRALKRAGYRLDCYAPKGDPDSVSTGLCHGVFENVFTMPDRESPVARHLDSAGTLYEDPVLSDKLGRDEASMVAAGVLVSISDYDIVGIHYTRCHSLKQLLPASMPVVMFTHDLDSLVCRQEEIVFGIPSGYQLEDEVSRLKPFDLVTVVGPDDRRALQSIAPDMPIVEAPFTAAVEERVPIREHSPGALLWISSAAPFHRLSFFWFWKNVWPEIRTARPECRLVIAGRISDVATQLGAAADTQVSVLGVVEDADRLYGEADILIAPYYFGLGVKTKIIQALAKGIPVVTTASGISNTHIQPGRDAIVTNDASEYASEVIRLISCPRLRAELAENGCEYVRKWHDPQKALADLVEGFERVRRARKPSLMSRGSTLRALHEPLRHLVPWTVRRCRDEGAKTIAIYGAGSHTRLLVPIWKALGGPAIKKIIVTGEPAEDSFLGFPLVGTERFNPAEVDAIVLSSEGYEEAMAAICRERWPDAKVHSIWRPVGPVEDFDSLCRDDVPGELYEYEQTAPLSV